LGRVAVFFESVTLGAFAVMIAVGVVFWAVGALGRRRGLTGETALVTEVISAKIHVM
jgi:hypothetical protein